MAPPITTWQPPPVPVCCRRHRIYRRLNVIDGNFRREIRIGQPVRAKLPPAAHSPQVPRVWGDRHLFDARVSWWLVAFSECAYPVARRRSRLSQLIQEMPHNYRGAAGIRADPSPGFYRQGGAYDVFGRNLCFRRFCFATFPGRFFFAR